MYIKQRNVRGLRLLAGALLVVTAAAGVAQVAVADTSNPPSVPQGSTSTTRLSGDTTQNAFTAAVEALVTRGIITQAQADAVQQQVLAGTVYPETLVANGTLSNDQMNQVVDSLGAVKRAMAGDSGTVPDQIPPPAKKPPAPTG
jgi:hypothetical protein